MKAIQEVYPDAGSSYFSVGSYQPMLESFGYPIVLQVDENDYQGDSYLLLQDGEKYGLLVFGWGSCSGCDALQACSNYEEVDALRAKLHSAIQWFDSAHALLDYLNTHDWEGDFSWYCDEGKQFVEQAKRYMKQQC